jgi:hypothetical protein
MDPQVLVLLHDLVVAFTLFLKIPFNSLSNIGLVDSSMSFAHLIVALISSINHFPSSHSDDDGDAKG